MRLAVPWYVHPVQTAHWLWLQRAPVEIAVINVSDGPGGEPDGQYLEALSASFTPTLIGYVDIAYGQRSFSEVMKDVTSWMSWYGMLNIFLDQVPTAPSQKNWDIDWLTRLRAYGVELVSVNPGTPPHSEIVMAADLSCVCEVSWRDYRGWKPPKRLLDLPPERQWHLVHSVPESASLNIGRQAQKKGASWSWATRAGLPDPWSAGREGR